MGGRKRKVEEDPRKKDAYEEEAEEETSPVSSGSKGEKPSSSQQQSPKVNKKASKDVQEGKGSSGEVEAVSPAKKAKSPSKKEVCPPKTVLDQDDEEDDDPMEEEEEIVPVAEEPENLPPVDVLHKLLEQMEQHLPKEDCVKYDSQVQKLDWEKISFEGLSAAQCQSTWMYIQKRIRRFRILSEMIPDAREWIQHPRTNLDRHPDMPHFTGAPERPFKPFDLFFKKEMEPCSSDPSFDRQAFARKCRKEWKEMKNKKKAKWIRSAFENYRKYEADLKEFISQNPGYVPPNASHKNFLTIEDQKILDRSMGRPEKPSSSAYSLFSKEMLNNEDIKKYPSKERMSHISKLWKTLPDEKKESYQSEVNEAMGIYRQRYEDWFNGLNDEERKAESDRNNSKSSRKAAAKEKANNNNLGGGQQVLQMGPNQYITLAPPQLQPVLLVAAPSVIPSSTQPMLDSVEKLKRDILEREPVEPVRSRKQLFISEWLPANKKKKLSDANKLWRQMGKKDKCKWRKKLQPQRQKYIEDYTLFVRGLSKQEVELYMDLKEKRDQEEDARKAQMSESDESDSSESESDDSSTNDEERKAESDRNNSKSSRKAAAKEKANNNNILGGGQQIPQMGPNHYITLAPPQPQPVLLAAAPSVIPSSTQPKKKLSDPKKIGVWWQMGKKEKRKWKRKYQPQTPKYIED